MTPASQVREEEIEEQHRQQVEERNAQLRRDYASQLATIHATRVRTVRQLAQARRRAADVAGPGGSSAALSAGTTRRRHDIISRYQDWASPGKKLRRSLLQSAKMVVFSIPN
jgi:hypothetical protein